MRRDQSREQSCPGGSSAQVMTSNESWNWLKASLAKEASLTAKDFFPRVRSSLLLAKLLSFPARLSHPVLSKEPKSRVCVLSHFSRVQLFATLWIVAHQAPLSVGFSRQKCWSGLSCLSPGDLPTQVSNPCLLGLLQRQAGSFPQVPPKQRPMI